ncbi:MAG: 4-(cytidine 5'-diphospho)-2-C-methyl-D-erythritol kinase [Actinomycetota bacterium]|nr:4-(cytidine 5'-diphospho)-2-C-methyl-D-erythritol kinase [Actinomycetota bacterium]
MTILATEAPAKINLSLFVGPPTPDGRHELVTVMDSLTLADDVRLTVGPEGLGADEVHCPGLAGPNLAAVAIDAFRERTGWNGPPVRVQITKRIPVAGGMAGGSADAAAVLRLLAAATDIDDQRLLEEIGAGLGSDVPSQVRGGLLLAIGAGERLRPLPRHEPYSALVLPVAAELSTAEVYAEADRLGIPRDALGLARALTRTQAALSSQTLLEKVHNDLEAAARSLCPAIDEALDAARRAGSDQAIVSGSGPTVVGLFCGDSHRDRAAAGRAALDAEGRSPGAIFAQPLEPMDQ